MKSRIAICSVLVCGGLMSAPTPGFATSGLSGSNDASVVQYGTPAPTPPAPTTPAPEAPAPRTPSAPAPAPVADAQEDRAPQVLPERESAARPTTPTTPTAPQGGVRPGTESRESAPSRNAAPAGDVSPAEGLQSSRQVEAGAQAADAGELPFTGFAAIPILVGGVALLGTGAALRRRTRDDA